MSRKVRLLLDAAILVAYLAANNPSATGISVHEWLSVGLAVAVAVHLALNWEWIGHTSRKLMGKLRAASKLNWAVDAVLFVAFVLLMLSGFMVSKSVLAVLGISVAHGGIWRLVHAQSANVALYALAIHFALHWRWMAGAAKSLFGSKTPVPVPAKAGEVS